MTEKSALLIIDVQQGLFERNNPVYRADETLANINLLAEKADKAGAPVVYIQHSNDKTLKWESPEWAFHSEINPIAGDLLIHKLHGNAFTETELEAKLRELGIERIVCCGLVTQGCVRATSLGGLDHGFEVVLASDAHSTFTKPALKIIERWHKDLSEAGVSLVLSEEISF